LVIEGFIFVTETPVGAPFQTTAFTIQ